MILKLIIIYFVIISLLFSVLVITSKNPVESLVLLITVFVCVALILILIGAEFIGISYILVYVGAIAILFLFVIMMINIRPGDILETGEEYTKSIPLAICIGVLLTYGILSLLHFYDVDLSFFYSKGLILNGANSLNSYLIDSIDLNSYPTVFITANPYTPDTQFLATNQIEAIGYSLYTTGAIHLIIVSLILLLGMLSAIFLATYGINYTTFSSPKSPLNYHTFF